MISGSSHLAVLVLEMKVWKMKNSLDASSTLILAAMQSVHASCTLLVFINFTNLVSLFDLGFKPFGCLAPGDESLEAEELLAFPCNNCT